MTLRSMPKPNTLTVWVVGTDSGIFSEAASIVAVIVSVVAVAVATIFAHTHSKHYYTLNVGLAWLYVILFL